LQPFAEEPGLRPGLFFGIQAARLCLDSKGRFHYERASQPSTTPGTQFMSKKTAEKTETKPPPAREKKENFITMFSKIDSKHRHQILAYLVWLLGLFIIFFVYRPQ
jgi:hypothetical protein